MNIFDSADVQTTGRLNGDEQGMFSVHLSCNYRFLLISARHAADDGNRSLPAANVVLFYQLIRIFSYVFEFYEPVFLKFRLEITLQNHILFQSIIQNESVFVPVLGNMTDTVSIAETNGRFGHVHSVKSNFPRGDGFQPGQSVNEFRLTVPVDTRNTYNFAGTNGKRHVVDGKFFVNFTPYRQTFNLQNLFFRLRRCLFHYKLYRSAHHHLRKVLLRRIFYIHGADVLSLTQYRTSVRNRHYLV